jgi:hypothetical protein
MQFSICVAKLSEHKLGVRACLNKIAKRLFKNGIYNNSGMIVGVNRTQYKENECGISNKC